MAVAGSEKMADSERQARRRMKETATEITVLSYPSLILTFLVGFHSGKEIRTEYIHSNYSSTQLGVETYFLYFTRTS